MGVIAREDRVYDVLAANGGLQDWTEDELRKLAREVVRAAGRSSDSDDQGAVDEAERLRTALAELLIYARGNQPVLDKIHAALDRPSGGR